MASKIAIAKTKELLSEVQKYFAERSNMVHKECVAVEDCNRNFQNIDNKLANTVQRLVGYAMQGNVYHFGVGIPSIQYDDNSILRKKACTCSNGAVSPKDKNSVRNLAETWLRNWEKSAIQWQHKGGLELEEKPFKQNTFSTGVARQISDTDTNKQDKAGMPKVTTKRVL